MENQKQYLRDITEIRTMMERSSKFLSLSGWSGILMGFYALAGAILAYDQIKKDGGEVSYPTILIAILVLIISLITAILFSYKKTRKNKEGMWSMTAQRVYQDMIIPLVTGGVLCLIFISTGLNEFLAPITLVFYGLALVQVSKSTFAELRILGLMEIVLGLIGAYFTRYGLILWALGFGLLHIVYGAYIYFKYEKGESSDK